MTEEKYNPLFIWIAVALILGAAVIVFNMALSSARQRKARLQYFEEVRKCQRQCDKFKADVVRVDLDCYCKTPGGTLIMFREGQDDPMVLRYREES